MRSKFGRKKKLALGLSFRPLPRLTDAELLAFEVPCGWRVIVTTPGDRYGDHDWWRDAVMEADEMGRGLLGWNKETRRWTLTARGRAHLGLPSID